MTAKSAEERRRFRRFRFSSVIRVREGDAVQECELLDVSLRGFLARCPADWRAAEGDRLRVEWRLAELIKLELDARVVHVSGDHIGCSWEARDPESFAHLKRLVEINLMDPKLVVRELESLRGESVKQFKDALH
ncbi:MAG: PilZ domain-containing protein [Gammaproteobacteria bacterium]|nr:PilZ domain-containing protein [Gammaproteobacteria bacterium]